MPVDGLTRTILRLGGEPTAESLESLVRILERVPGVLVVVADRLAGSVSIDHDGAVEMGSLHAGVHRAGFTAAPAGGSAEPAVRRVVTRRPGSAEQQTIVLAGFVVCSALMLLEAYDPTAIVRRWILFAVFAIFWTLYFASREMRRRTK